MDKARGEFLWFGDEGGPWGNRGSRGVEEGDLRDGWRYILEEPNGDDGRPSGWFLVTLMRDIPKGQGEHGSNAVASGYSFGLACRNIDDARAVAHGCLTALRLLPGYPDSLEIARLRELSRAEQLRRRGTGGGG